MEAFSAGIANVSDFIWNTILLYLLVGTGIFFTIRLKFVQIRRFGNGWRRLFGGGLRSGKATKEHGMSTFQAAATAIAAQVGTGNIVGAATALAAGGPGAIFWMWLAAFFGMATIYSEATMAQRYKTKGKDGEVTGGPVYYIRAAFKGGFGKFLAGFFAVCIIIALGLTGNGVQANSISNAFYTAWGVPPLVTGICLAVVALIIFLGGISRIASVTEKVVPFMAVIYVVGGIIIIAINFRMIPEAFREIFVGAFAPASIAGGVLGVTVQQAMRYGVARGLFSNEAGLGSTPHAHSVAHVKQPGDQGSVAIVSVFIDTFIVLTITALVVITSGILTTPTMSGFGATGFSLASSAYTCTLGSFAGTYLAFCLFFFAFSTIIGWYFFAVQNVKYLFGPKAVKVFAVISCLSLVLFSSLEVPVVWNLADLCNGLMVLPNLIALLALNGTVVKLSNSYDGIMKNRKAGLNDDGSPLPEGCKTYEDVAIDDAPLLPDTYACGERI